MMMETWGLGSEPLLRLSGLSPGKQLGGLPSLYIISVMTMRTKYKSFCYYLYLLHISRNNHVHIF